MKFTAEIAAISLAYRTKYRIALGPEFAFFGPFTDAMEQVLSRVFRLSNENEAAYRASCHEAISMERDFVKTCTDEEFEAMYGPPSPESLALAFTSASLRREERVTITESVQGLFERSGYDPRSYRSIHA